MPTHEETFLAAFDAHSDELFRHASMRIADRERAKDLIQDCFMRAWEYLTKGGTVEKYRPFLYRILNNLIIDEYRKRKVVSLDSLLENEETTNAVEGALLTDDTDIFEEAATQFDADKALETVMSLPEQYKTVILMRYVEGLSPSEIAESLEESENAVSVRIHRGVRKLKELLTSLPQ